MYFVDRNKIEDTLIYMSEKINLLKEIQLKTEVEYLAFERIAQMIIESILDVGNLMIDGFIMRDPGSYDDIIDILLDEKVINKEDEAGLKEIIAFRKNLVQQYLQIEHTKIHNTLIQNVTILESFPSRIKSYLDNELGPVSAFKN